MVTLPEIPTCPARMQCRPIVTLWPIWTRLSILLPSPITVSRMLPRSIVVLAPISTSSWMMTRPTCGIFCVALRAGNIAVAVLADPHAGMDDDAVADQRMGDRGAGADACSRGRSAPPARSMAPAAMTVPAPISARGPITAPGSIVTPFSSRAEGCTWAPAATPAASNSEDGRTESGNSERATATKAR